MKENNLISIIVPVYKVEQYLKECVLSITNQTYSNLEIILVDDGSPDDCPKMCDDFAKLDKRIIVIHKKNGGLSSARNAGLDIAKGDFICFVDSDDFITPDYVEVMYERINKEATVGIVSGMIYRYQDCQTFPFNTIWNISKENIVKPDEFTIKCINKSISYTVWNKLYRADLIKNVRFREGRNNEDTLYMYDLGKYMYSNHFSMVEIPHFVYYYRYREDSICTSTKVPLDIDIIKNQHDMMDDCEKSDKKIWSAIYFQYSKNLFAFVDSLLLNEMLRPLYFKIYQAELRQIPFSYIWSKYNYKNVIYIQLLKWFPCVRKQIKLISQIIASLIVTSHI